MKVTWLDLVGSSSVS